MKRLVALTAGAALALTPAAQAHDQAHKKIAKRWQLSAYKVAWYNGGGHWTLRPRFARCNQIRWPKPRGRCFRHRANLSWHQQRMNRLARILWPPQQAATTGGVSYWAGRQIRAATVIAQESAGDPWPNCPDPHDGTGTWGDTVACENGGNWYDTPGYYRCGLQFDPAWEQRFGRLCP